MRPPPPALLLARIRHTAASRWLAGANRPWDHKSKCSARCEPSSPRVGVARLGSMAGHRILRSRRTKTGIRKSQSSGQWSLGPIKRWGRQTGQACPQRIRTFTHSTHFEPVTLFDTTGSPAGATPQSNPHPTRFQTLNLSLYCCFYFEPVTLFESRLHRILD